MDKNIIRDLLAKKKNFVFIGEAGSGKSELTMNFAQLMTEVTDKPVHVFDMDQTKGMFRTRDVSELLEEMGIIVHSQKQLLDAPTLVPGVIETLTDPDSYTLMDIGGNETGARMIGQFSHVLNDDNTCVFFVINTYRPWSKDIMSINETLFNITRVSRIKKVNIISNPNLGLETTPDDVVAGNDKLKEMLADSDVEIDYVCVLSDIYDEVKDRVKEPLIPVDIFIIYPWLMRNPGKIIPEGPRGLSMR